MNLETIIVIGEVPTEEDNDLALVLMIFSDNIQITTNLLPKYLANKDKYFKGVDVMNISKEKAEEILGINF